MGTPTGVPALSSGSTTLASGASVVVTYPITGTPASTGSLTGTWTKLMLNCIGTQPVLLVASLTTLNCTGATNTGTLMANTIASGISSAIAYTGGNGGGYGVQSIASTGVTGLTATLTTGALATGGGSVTYTITGTPASEGTASFAITLGGQSCTLTRPVGIFDRAYGQTINGANNHNFVYFPVTGADGKTWLNNNLGAHYANVNHTSYNPSQQATSATDYKAYGSLFQWGRGADGHELIKDAGNKTPQNGTTTTLSDGDTPVDNLYILATTNSNDWRKGQNPNLWQGVNGINNPCPVGYRVPTSAELTNLVTTAGITSVSTAAGSTLKFSMVGFRYWNNGAIYSTGTEGNYWTSTISGTGASNRIFNGSGTSGPTGRRALGFAVRCLKN